MRFGKNSDFIHYLKFKRSKRLQRLGIETCSIRYLVNYLKPDLGRY